jgi:glyoxylase-like metal-dependent hydrolase (beta-lactamase superfamily II)
MKILSSLHPRFLSRSYLLMDEGSGEAALIDSGAPMDALLPALESGDLRLRYILCTHHHHDHIEHNGDYAERFGAPILAARLEAPLFAPAQRTLLSRELEDGDSLSLGGLVIRCLLIPGHTVGQMAFLASAPGSPPTAQALFTGDTLFRGSVGGTMGPGHTSFEDLRHSIMENLMSLPHETPIYPGHCDPSTLRKEWEENPFIRLWRGLIPSEERSTQAFGRPVTLMLRAPDYDGGSKCQIRFEEDGRLAIAPGSRVE